MKTVNSWPNYNSCWLLFGVEKVVENQVIWFDEKLTIVTSSIFDILLTRVLTLTIVGPSLPVIDYYYWKQLMQP